MGKTYYQAWQEREKRLRQKYERMQRDTPVSGYPAVLGWRVVTKQVLIAVGLALGGVLTGTLAWSYVATSWTASKRLGERFIDSGLWPQAAISCLVFSWLAFEAFLAARSHLKKAWTLARYLRAVREDWK